MSNALTVLGKNALPAHLRNQAPSHDWDKVGGQSVPRIEVSDRRIKAVIAGAVVQETKDPIAVVLMKPGNIGRTYYAKEYKKGDKVRPDCSSLDGIKPLPDSPNKQCSSCDLCPMNVKGSSKTMADAKACRYRQPIAIWLPGEKTDDMIFRLSLSATGIFPDEANSDGYKPLNAYIRDLRAAGASPNMVWTEMAIDGDQDQARILFKPIGYIEDPEDFSIVQRLMDDPQMEQVLGALNDEDSLPDNVTPDGVVKHTDKPGPDDEVDDVDTYWYHEASDALFIVPAGKALPTNQPGMEELTLEDYTGMLAEQEAERAQKAAEERQHQEAAEAQRLAAEAAAKAAASTGRRRGATTQAEAPAQTEAPAGRRRAATTVAEDPAPSGRRRAATTVAEDPAPSGRRRAADATTVAEDPAPSGRRRANVMDAGEVVGGRQTTTPEPGPDATATVSAASRRRRAAEPAADEAPRTRTEVDSNQAALEEAILAESDDE